MAFGFGFQFGVGATLSKGGGVPVGYDAFLVKLPGGSFSTFEIKKADGTYARLVVKEA